MNPSTILIIDAEEAVRDSLQLILEEEGYRCLVAADKETALELLSRESIGAVVIDSQLIGSKPFFGLLKATLPEIRIIIMSSYAEIEVTQKALMWGAHDFIIKPLDFNELTEKLKLQFSSIARK